MSKHANDKDTKVKGKTGTDHKSRVRSFLLSYVFAQQKQQNEEGRRDYKQFQYYFEYAKVVPIDEETIIEASIIRSTHQLSYWDSLVMVSAISSKCTILILGGYAT